MITKDDFMLGMKRLNEVLNLADDIQPLVDKGFNLHHEGRCCRCGRVLSTPESCDRGIGPECWKHLNGGNYPNISTNGTFSE